MRAICLALCGLLLLGCYRFSTGLPGHIKTVSVPVFENETLKAELTEELTAAVTDRFLKDNQLRVINRNADSVLEGKVVGYQDRVSGFTSDRQADEYGVIITVNLAFRDRIKRKDVWVEEGVTGFSTYYPGGTQAGIPKTEDEAREEAVRQIVDIIMSRTFQGW